MQDPLQVVRAFARRHELWHPRLRVVAAVSGGSDSVAMFLLLRELSAQGEVELAGLAHVNHHIRPGASDADEAFCRALAARSGVAPLVAHADVPRLAQEHRQSIEVAARHARHQALAKAAVELGADRIATAHTRDDQAETVLLHLTRGAGLPGARGIEPRSGAFIRPLLNCARTELQRWLTANGEQWREDETNADLANPRNRIRHVVLPALREAFNPAVDAALARFADILREEHAYLNEQAGAAAARVISSLPEGPSRPRPAEPGLAIDREALVQLPVALGRRVVRLALETVHASRSYDLIEVDAVLDACREPSDAPRDLRGVRMERSGRFVVLLSRGASRAAAAPGESTRFEYELPVPGRIAIEESHAVLEADGPFTSPITSDSETVSDGASLAVIRADELGDGLLVRNRREGDRLRLWNVGHKKLQDLFVDRKVDRLERDRVPIVTDRSGRIVWVAGHAVAEEFRVSPLTTTVVTLRLRPLRNRGPQPA